MKFIFTGLALLFFSLDVNAANWSISPFIGFGNTASDNGVTKTTSTNTELDLHVGYTFDNGFYAGLLYDVLSTTTKSETLGISTTSSSSFGAYGPGIGYKNSGFFGFFHYLLEPKLEFTSTTTTKYYGGTGMQIDIGYAFLVSGTFWLGLDYRTLIYDFKKRDDPGGSTSTIDQKTSNGIIMAALIFEI